MCAIAGMWRSLDSDSGFQVDQVGLELVEKHLFLPPLGLGLLVLPHSA